ncbi:MAG: ATP-grasp domain-containing protein [Methanobacterium sp.]|nr:ATP-grasp domain-containing protein [Methanobacterium sp.]
MENILLVGVNTRAVACSLKKLGYNIYSADYFGTSDSKSCTDYQKSFLHQKPLISCGYFAQNFHPHIIKEMALEMAHEVDSIICCAGASPSWFHASKIIGNSDVGMVEDKFFLFEKLKDIFNLPETYLPADIYEIQEIIKNYNEKEFILKPRHGAGGYGVRMAGDLDLIFKMGYDGRITPGKMNLDDEIESRQWILQEFIGGENISASVLSNGDEARTILTSTQIIGNCELGQKEPFGYCGNLVPNTGIENISEMASKVVGHLSLIGSNGVDFISRNGELYLIEVNPRLQGTFECAELSLDVNMAELHLAACHGHLMEVPQPRRFSVKMVVHARHRSQWKDLNIPGIYDLPYPGVIIEKGEPMVTIVTSHGVMEDAMFAAKRLAGIVYNSVKHCK